MVRTSREKAETGRKQESEFYLWKEEGKKYTIGVFYCGYIVSCYIW